MGVGDFVYNGVASAGATSNVSGFDLRISGNTTGTTALVSSGTLTLAGGTNITLSQNGNAITIVGANTGTLTQWFPAMQGGSNTRVFGQSSIHVDPIWVPAYVTASRANLLLSVSLSTSSNSSHAGTLSYHLGCYTNNASTLSLASSGSVSYAWTNTSDNSSASLQSQKVMSLPINLNLTPGNYWIGHLLMTASAGANWITIANLGLGGNSNNGSFAGASSGTFNPLLGGGHFSVVSAAMPVSMAFTDLRNNAPADIQQQMISFVNGTA